MNSTTRTFAAGRRWSVWRRAAVTCAGVVLTSCLGADVPDTDQAAARTAGPAGAPDVLRVRVALGWRAREVERQSPGVQRFNDQDVGVIIVEEGPVALAYADPAHAFVLPPGRYLRLDQAAGRVHVASASPQMDVLGPEEAVTLGDSIVRVLEGAGWQRDTVGWRGPRAAVAEAARLISSEGTGRVDVGAWRIPRSREPWAALPPDPLARPRLVDGVQARLSVRPIKGRSATAGAPRLLFTLDVDDELLGGTLLAMVETRRARHGGEMQTLTGWDREPAEPLALGGPR